MDVSPSWTDGSTQNHSLGPDHKSVTQLGPLCHGAELLWSPERNAHLTSEGLKGMRRGAKIPSWRDGNGYLTKLHIRASNFQS